MAKNPGSIEDKPIGWTNESDPHGAGYQIMTENGLETYDIEEHSDFLKEVERINNYLKERGKR
jgi:hypothetical protein